MTEQEQIREVIKAETRPIIQLLKDWATAPRYPDIAGAINTAMRVPFSTIKKDSRKRWHVYARMIYAQYSKLRGANNEEIAKDTDHDTTTICYYLRRYQQELKYNREFRAAAEKVEQLINPQQPQE